MNGINIHVSGANVTKVSRIKPNTMTCNLKSIKNRLNDMQMKIDTIWKIFSPSRGAGKLQL